MTHFYLLYYIRFDSEQYITGDTIVYGIMDDTFRAAQQLYRQLNIESINEFILDFYADGVANVEEHSTYLSREELDVFVTSAVKEIITQIGIWREK